ncbi:hypothetical protein SMITH_353 [Smithella sp. ME-1]|nr:hypothetical protein SMITH_353 [Smithella sp. ME-1]
MILIRKSYFPLDVIYIFLIIEGRQNGRHPLAMEIVVRLPPLILMAMGNRK